MSPRVRIEALVFGLSKRDVSVQVFVEAVQDEESVIVPIEQKVGPINSLLSCRIGKTAAWERKERSITLHDFKEDCWTGKDRVGTRGVGVLVLFVGDLVKEFDAD
jgi:hypothetical protein